MKETSCSFMEKQNISLSDQSFGTIARLYKMDPKTLQKNIKVIRPKLDKMVGRDNYRNLIPKQVKLIFEHMGEPEHYGND